MGIDHEGFAEAHGLMGNAHLTKNGYNLQLVESSAPIGSSLP
jgi:hypothetical protein